MTQAGDLKFRIAFESRAIVGDDYGASEGDFAERFRRWGNLVPKLGGERILADRLAGITSATVTVRRDVQTAALSTAWRLREMESNVVYDIKSVIDPNNRREWIEILATRGGAT